MHDSVLGGLCSPGSVSGSVSVLLPVSGTHRRRGLEDTSFGSPDRSRCRISSPDPPVFDGSVLCGTTPSPEFVSHSLGDRGVFSCTSIKKMRVGVVEFGLASVLWIRLTVWGFMYLMWTLDHRRLSKLLLVALTITHMIALEWKLVVCLIHQLWILGLLCLLIFYLHLVMPRLYITMTYRLLQCLQMAIRQICKLRTMCLMFLLSHMLMIATMLMVLTMIDRLLLVLHLFLLTVLEQIVECG